MMGEKIISFVNLEILSVHFPGWRIWETTNSFGMFYERRRELLRCMLMIIITMALRISGHCLPRLKRGSFSLLTRDTAILKQKRSSVFRRYTVLPISNLTTSIMMDIR